MVSTDRADEAVIVEGVAEEISDRAALKPFYEAYKEKYDWDLEQMGFDKEPVYAVRPRVVFGVRESDFTSSVTRWTFEDKVVGGQVGHLSFVNSHSSFVVAPRAT